MRSFVAVAAAISLVAPIFGAPVVSSRLAVRSNKDGEQSMNSSLGSAPSTRPQTPQMASPKESEAFLEANKWRTWWEAQHLAPDVEEEDEDESQFSIVRQWINDKDYRASRKAGEVERAARWRAFRMAELEQELEDEKKDIAASRQRERLAASFERQIYGQSFAAEKSKGKGNRSTL